VLGKPLLVAVIGVAACSHDHGPPKVLKPGYAAGQPLSNALRGGGPPRSPRIANYKLDARLDSARHVVTATETLTWTNTGQSAVDMLPFHLYLNAFKNESSLFWRTSNGVMRTARASESGWGWIQIDSVTVSGVELVSKLRYPGAPDETVAELPLSTAVEPGQSVEVGFRFTEQLPEVWARTGYKGDFHIVGQWFPKIGVRVGTPGAEHWECQPFHAFNEFFADFGTYDVTLTLPNTFAVAATGVLVSATDLPGGTRTLTYRAEDVHDFVWVADPFMKQLLPAKTVKVDDGATVEVRVWYRPEQEAFARRHQEAAAGAIERFSALLVPYPYSVMTIIDTPVDAAAGAGGMEYPTLVTTAGDSVFSRPGIRIPEFTTVHEVGHNWFQGLLASNEPEEPWLDEGVNMWADSRVMDDLYGARTGVVDWMGWQGEAYAVLRAAARDPSSVPSPIATAAYAFGDFEAYASLFDSTNRALRTLELSVGSAKLWAAIKTYAKTWAFRHPTGRDLFAVLETELATDLSWFTGPVFHDVGAMALSVRTASCKAAHPPRGVFGDGTAKKTQSELEAPESGSWECEVVVQNTGAWHVPVEIELRFADGSSQRVRWDDHGNGSWQRFAIQRSSRLVEVRLDPDGKILLDSPVTHAVRVDGNGAASLRAAARIASWQQTLAQLVGI
jgi:hypothetical protein